MFLWEIIENLDTSPENRDDIDITEIAQEVFDLGNVPYIVSKDLALKAFWICRQNCIDGYVGIRAYYLDDVFVGISEQTGRKDGENFQWKDKDSYFKVQDYLLSLAKKNLFAISLVNMDEDLGDGYRIDFSDHIPSRIMPTFMGEPVTSMESVKSGTWTERNAMVYITIANSNERHQVEVRDLLFPYRTKKEVSDDAYC